MKIDDAIIDKVLNNKASAEDAKAVSEWLATEEGHDYLSKRIDREVSSLTENEVEDAAALLTANNSPSSG